MKRKLFLLVACVLVASTSFAQKDVTSTYITNATLSSLNGWTNVNFNTPQRGNNTTGYASECYAGWGSLEKTNYSLTQTITLPAGNYTLVCYAFFRYGLAYNTDASKSLAYLKAGDASVAIKTLGSITAAGYANSQAEGANAFDSKMYRNTLDFTIDADNTSIEIGAYGTFDLKQSWMILGMFELINNDIAATMDAPYDVTGFMTNPGFEYRDMTGWSLSESGAFGTQNNSQSFKIGGYYAEKWQASGALTARSMSQTLTNLPAGYYKLTANVGGDGTYIDLNGKTMNGSGTTADITTGYVLEDGEDLTITAGKTASGSANWIHFDNFKLYFCGDVASALTTLLEQLSSYESKLPASIYNTLSNNVSAYDQSYSDVDELLAAITAVQNLYNAADVTVAAYATLKAGIDDYAAKAATLDEAGATAYQSNAAVIAVNEAYTNGTYTNEQAVAAVSTLEAALRDAAKAQTTAGADMTLAIINNSFETGDLTGWTTTTNGDTGVKSNSNNTYHIDNANGDYLFNTWNGDDTGYDITQTITGMPTGKYKLQAIIAGYVGGRVDLIGNDSKTTNTNTATGTADEVEVEFSAFNGSVTIGAGNADHWYKADYFRLTFVEAISLDDFYSQIEALIIEANKITGTQSAETSAELTAAVTEGQGYLDDEETDVETLAASIDRLSAAIVASNTSVAEFARGAAMNALINGNNSVVLTDEATLGNWTPSPREVNTWSTEADNTGMVTPFVQNWLSAGNILPDYACSYLTIRGVQDGYYEVSALVRIYSESGAEPSATSAVFTVNDESVDLLDGTSFTYNNLKGVYQTVSIKTQLNDALSIGLSYSGVNFNWISWKDLKVTYLAESEEAAQKVIARQELAAAIAGAPAVPTANVGEKAFQYSATDVANVGSVVAAAQAVYNDDDASLEDINAQTVLVNALEITMVAPDAATGYYLIKNDGWDYDGKAMTMSMGHPSQGDAQGAYSTVPQNGNSLQLIYFEQQSNTYEYKMYFINGNDKEYFHQATAASIGGSNAQGVRWSTTEEDAMVVKVTPSTTVDGNYTFTCTANNIPFGAQDVGIYLVNSHTNFNIADAAANMQISAIAKMGTFCAPFDVTIPDGVSAYTAEKSEEGDWLSLTAVNGTIEAGTPVILEAKDITEALSADFAAMAETNTTNDDVLIGVYTLTTVSADDEDYKNYIMQYKNQKTAFFLVSDDVQVGANRCYLQLENSAEAPARIAIGREDETGIKSLEQIENEAQTKKDGKYLVGGRIVVVKNGKVYNVSGAIEK